MKRTRNNNYTKHVTVRMPENYKLDNLETRLVLTGLIEILEVSDISMNDESSKKLDEIDRKIDEPEGILGIVKKLSPKLYESLIK